MIFLFPKKQIILDCFIDNEVILKTAPIVSAIKLIPDWWKNLPTSYTNVNGFSQLPTMKSCVGMVDYYKKSIAIPLWSDLSIKVYADGQYRWQFSDMQTKSSIHDVENQATNFANDFGHIKIITPWKLSCNKEINWVWSHPTYNYPNSIDVGSLPGITNFYHQHLANINLLISKKQEKTIFLPQGQIMAVLTPMTDKKVKIVRHLVSTQEIEKYSTKSISITFLQKYKNNINLKNKFSQCPYKTK